MTERIFLWLENIFLVHMHSISSRVFVYELNRHYGPSSCKEDGHIFANHLVHPDGQRGQSNVANCLDHPDGQRGWMVVFLQII